MKNRQNRQPLFKWEPRAITGTACIVGCVIIMLSLCMRIVIRSPVLTIAIRDILMILVCGIVLPLHFIGQADDFSGYGLTVKRWQILLPINLLLSAGLLALFLKQFPLPADFSVSRHTGEIAYIMVTGIFEMIIFYSFIRTAVERSFGIIPGIVVAALLYSLHHAGFEPDFVKLFFVGILYATTFRLANNILIIYPFFWGAGALYDVLVTSKVVSAIVWPWPRAVLIFAGIGFTCALLRKNAVTARMPEGGAILDADAMSTDEYGELMQKNLGVQYRRFASNANAILALPQNAHILEIGPGPGWAGIELMHLRPDITVTGLEPSLDMIRTATKNAAASGCGTRVNYVDGFVEDLSQFTDGKFDAVISRDSLHHWENPEKAFCEIERVLSRNGKLYITDCKRNLSFAERYLVSRIGKIISPPMFDGWKNSIRAAYTPNEIETVCVKNNLAHWTVRPALLNVVITRRVYRS